ncbi:MAG: hypothetical protein ACRD9R_18385, partial [Pyrinomonadaceae bacterium]
MIRPRTLKPTVSFNRPRFTRRGISLKLAALFAVCAAAGGTTAIGCGWFGPTDSVRFAGYDDPERIYSRLPALNSDDLDSDAESDDAGEAVGSGVAEELSDKELDALWRKATALTAAPEELEQSRRELQDYLNHDRHSYWSALPLSPQQKRNTAIDLLDALGALDAGSPGEAVQAYMKARQAYDSWLAAADAYTQFVPYGQPKAAALTDEDKAKLADEARHSLAELPPDQNLTDNRAFLEAAILYQEDKFFEAAQSFAALAALHPRSEKREAALLLAGLAHLKQSGSYQPDDVSGVSSKPCAGCRDASWRAARASFTRLLREYPRGRYVVEARGWNAFLSLRVGDYGAALADYYRLLADEDNRAALAEALKSLDMARPHADEASLKRLEAELMDEPPVALVYAYHNIYNYALDLGPYDFPLIEDEEDESAADSSQPDAPVSEWVQREREQRRERKLETARRRELRRIADFAVALMRRHPRAAFGGDFALRVAEAKLELNDSRAAHQFARRALALGVRGERRIEAMWVKGVAEYRRREYAAARRTLTSLLGESPRGRLTKGARTMLAMLAEDAGDTDAALEQYLALGYQEDVAYFIDVLMTPEQLAGFIERHPQSEHLDELNYALGVRHLRDGRYDEARAAYARVRTSRKSDDQWNHDYYGSGCDETGQGTRRCDSPKLADYSTEAGVRDRWVLRDLKTIEALERFERDVAAAQGEEAQAEALYQTASYLYESDLLFYNPAAWRGARYMNLAYLDETHAYRAAGEAERLWQYTQAHDMKSRALVLYLEVVRRYPNTRAARDALYTAAVCHERLSEYNSYWRNAYANGLHAGARKITYKDVRAAYPDYHLPRGTYGWQPSTRTVNGGPGWDAPLKPQPRPTRRARFKQAVEKFSRQVGRELRQTA